MLRLGLVVAAFSLCAACGDDGASAIFEVPGAAGANAESFYDLPFPNDLRRHEDGTLDLADLPTNSLLVNQLRAASETLDGFGLNGGMYARFDGALDPASLPDPAGSLAETASVYLVCVDPVSPHNGERVPIVARYQAAGYQTLPPHSLSVRPYPGFPLHEGTTYALVITRRVKAANGGAVGAGSQIRDVLTGNTDAALSHAHDVYSPLVTYLDDTGADTIGDVVSATVFTTQHATNIAEALRKGVAAAPAPVATDLMLLDDLTAMRVYTGNYLAPNFQAGDVPYRNAPTGRITVGTDGAAIQQRMEPLRFTIAIPTATMPAGGFPIAIYSHGTGGDYHTSVEDGTAERLAGEGIATISMDQVLHGPRNPSGNPELDFFNFGNVYAARDNALQGHADAFSQLRLAQGLALVDGTRTVMFDPTRVYFFGHSQGGLTGPGFVAFEPSLTGAVLSGTAGLLYLNLLHKTNPLDIPALVETFLRDEPLDEDNPSLALVQMWVDRSDPANYAPLMVRELLAGVQPRSVFQTEGFTDTYSPNIGIEAFATALGGDLVMEPAKQDILGLTLRGRTTKTAPITDNLNGVTAVLAQFNQRPGSDGHFVIFDIPAAKQQTTRFLGTLSTTGKATVVPAN